MEPLPTRPLTPAEGTLRERFEEEVVKQNDRLDDLAGRLVTVELAIPGLYATALKLTAGNAAALGTPALLLAAFLLWLAALAMTLAALFPARRRVDPTLIRRLGPAAEGAPLAIEEFYRRSAERKRRWLLLGCLAFLLGVLCAGLTVLA